MSPTPTTFEDQEYCTLYLLDHHIIQMIDVLLIYLWFVWHSSLCMSNVELVQGHASKHLIKI